MKLPADLPTYATGLQQVFTALRATPPPRGMSSEDFKWESTYAIQQDSNNLISLRELGYSLKDYEDSILDMTSFKGPFKILTNTGEILLRKTCLQLEIYARNSNFIISKRARAADSHSTFIYDMIRDRNFLLNLSKIAQAPLVPHLIRNAATQVNYYYPEDGDGKDKKIAKWHTDGMNFVFNILLSDDSEFEGGDFIYFKGPANQFTSRSNDNLVATSPSKHVGDTIYVHGSKVFHAVTPVTKGKRISIILSMYCPYLPEMDANTFWHVAGDDGILATLKNWGVFQSAKKSAHTAYSAIGCAPITWEDLA
ncbi:2OG-Fe(II) oxygenase family protein [Edaphovirga cremea]|uniref:2OG-Fe(II) oxygenase family protein n=1 Tax=Edaphovirga cremea TaxID=2267246 RepID=UPI0039891E93